MQQSPDPDAPRQYRRLEDVLGCKWSVSVLQAIAGGVQRPGALERHIAGISAKILSERLRKLEGYALISKSVQATKPPRTDYALTPHGRKVVTLIAQVRALDEEIHRAERRPSVNG
jgi:DNA-binding HxlR family transcriptional regulator